MKKDKQIKIISCILSLVISTGFTVLSYVFCIYYSYFNVHVIEDCIYSSGYYIEAYEQFNNDVSDILIPTGFPQEVFMNIVNPADMKNAITRYVKNVMEINIVGTNTEALETAIRENSESYFIQENIEMTEELSNVIDELVTYISDSYTENVSNKWFLYLGFFKGSFRQSIIYYFIPVAVITLIATIVLFVIQRWKHRACRYLIYSSTVAAILSAAGPTALYISQIYKRLYIQPKYFYDFAIYFIENGLKNMYIVSFIWFIIIVILFVVIKISKKQLHNSHRI